MISHQPEDMDRYRDFLEKVGRHAKLTQKQIRYRISVLDDPWWRDRLKISEEVAAPILMQLRLMLHKQRATK